MRFTFTNTPFQFLLAEASRDLRPRGCAVWFAPGLRRVEHVHVGDGQAVAALYQSSLGTPGGMVDLAYLVVERDGSHTVYEVPSSDCGCIQVPGATWTEQELLAALGESPVLVSDPEPEQEPGKRQVPAEAGRVRLYYIGQSVESHAVRGDEPSRTQCGRVLLGVDLFTVRLGQPSCQVCYARLQRLAGDWAVPLMAGGDLAARLALMPEPAEGSVVATPDMVWLRVTTEADGFSWFRIGDARPYSWREILREHWPVVVMREGW